MKAAILTASHVVCIVAGAVTALLMWRGCGPAGPSGEIAKSKKGVITVEKVVEKTRYINVYQKCPDGAEDVLTVDKTQIREYKLWHDTNNILLPRYYFGVSGKAYGHGAGLEYYRRFGRFAIGGGAYGIAVPGQFTYGVTAGVLFMF